MPCRSDLLGVAEKFGQGGCCGGHASEITMEDLVRIGITSLPQTWKSSFGLMVPNSGWKALCIYVVELLTGIPCPIPVRPQGAVRTKTPDIGETVAEMLRVRSESFDEEGRYIPRHGDFVMNADHLCVVTSFMETESAGCILDLVQCQSKKHSQVYAKDVQFLRRADIENNDPLFNKQYTRKDTRDEG